MADLQALEIALESFSPNRLRTIREAFPLSTQELAERVEVAPSTISQLETGRNRPRLQTIRRLSVALGVPLAYFFAGDLPVLEEEHCFFRRQRSARVKERHLVLARGSIALLLLQYLRSQVEFPTARIEEFRKQLGRESSPEVVAALLRRFANLGEGPISTMVGLLEGLGVVPIEIPGHSATVDAFSTWYQDHPVVFLLPDKQSASRRRFDSAHELGHLLMHKAASHGEDYVEHEANSFAAALILPRYAFLDEFPRRLDWQVLLGLKQRWGASLALMIRRAFDLGVIRESVYRRAFQELNSLEWRKTEPMEPSMERPQLIGRAMSLLEDAGVSKAQVSASLNLHPDHLERILGPSLTSQAA